MIHSDDDNNDDNDDDDDDDQVEHQHPAGTAEAGLHTAAAPVRWPVVDSNKVLLSRIAVLFVVDIKYIY